jgi:hypothetical protein
MPGSIDSVFAALARHIEGFGGLYRDPARGGQVVVRLTNPETQTAVLRTGLPELLPESFEVYEDVVRGDYRIEEGKYDFVQLARWKVQLRQFLQNSGVRTLDIDEVNNRMALGVADEAAQSAVEKAFRRNSVPTDAVSTQIVGQPVYLSGPSSPVYKTPKAPILSTLNSSTTLEDYYRPIAGGQEIARIIDGEYRGTPCTLTIIARDRVDGILQKVMITASHCTGGNGFVNGAKYNQPEFASGPDLNDIVGEEVKDASFRSGLPGCPSGKICRYSDSAIIDLEDSYFYKSAYGHIFETTGIGSNEIKFSNGEESLFRVDSDGQVVSGTPVNKIGRKSGWTQGPVQATCAAFNDPNTTDGVALCQNTAKLFAEGGDSGSPVFVGSNSSQTVIFAGLIWRSAGFNEVVFSTFTGMENDHGTSLKVEDS